MTEPTISEMQAANTVKRIRGYFESKRMEIEGNGRSGVRHDWLKLCVWPGNWWKRLRG